MFIKLLKLLNCMKLASFKKKIMMAFIYLKYQIYLSNVVAIIILVILKVNIFFLNQKRNSIKNFNF